jgi:predicted nucleic acid-binding protein
MKALVDTNVALDVILQRSPFYHHSFAIFQMVDQGHISACLSATTMTTIFYVLRKARNNSDETYRMMDELTALFSVAPVSEITIANALALRWKDFEDAVQYMVATESGVDCIVTRNVADYKTSVIPCMSPEDFIAYFNAHH